MSFGENQPAFKISNFAEFKALLGKTIADLNILKADIAALEKFHFEIK